jgi:rhodanese-related sulfurtransferase
MKRNWMLLLVAVLAAFIVFGCKDDSTDPDENAMEILEAYMMNNSYTLTDMLAGWIIGPDSLTQVLDDYYVMDIRTGDTDENGIVDYDDGHIPGAVLSSLGGILTDAASADKPIVVVCYTGQAAGHAVMALRLSGFEAQVLKWGMSGWHSDFDKWTGNCAQLNNTNWLAAPGNIEASEVFEYPEFESELEEGAGILAERVAYMLEEGFKGVAAVNADVNGVLDDPSMYFINNFWTADDVTTYGNITGAYRINPLVLENLDPNETVVTYCWTGQTSSMITAYLTVLGYDAKSLKFGANGMIYDDLTGHKWSASMDYPYDVTVP